MGREGGEGRETAHVFTFCVSTENQKQASFSILANVRLLFTASFNVCVLHALHAMQAMQQSRVTQ